GFWRNSGTVYLTGTLNDAGGTLALADATTGTWNLNGGTIVGGTVTTSGGAKLVARFGGTLDGVTLNGTLDMASFSGNSVTVKNGLTLNSTLPLGDTTFGIQGSLVFSGSQTLGGTGTIVLGSNAGNSLS